MTGAVILAAGQGTRMRSHRAKVLHELAGRPLLDHVLARVRALSLSPVVVVIGFDAVRVEAPVVVVVWCLVPLGAVVAGVPGVPGRVEVVVVEAVAGAAVAGVGAGPASGRGRGSVVVVRRSRRAARRSVHSGPSMS